jgi:hypothetical protein
VGAGSDDERGWAGLLRDPLIRLVMRSDGVSEAAMIAVMEQLRSSLAGREAQVRQLERRPRPARFRRCPACLAVS